MNIKEPQLYENETELSQHMRAIENIAHSLNISEEDVTMLYWIVLKRFKSQARVRDFLPILVSRRVEYLLYIRKQGQNKMTIEECSGRTNDSP